MSSRLSVQPLKLNHLQNQVEVSDTRLIVGVSVSHLTSNLAQFSPSSGLEKTGAKEPEVSGDLRWHRLVAILSAGPVHTELNLLEASRLAPVRESVS